MRRGLYLFLLLPVTLFAACGEEYQEGPSSFDAGVDASRPVDAAAADSFASADAALEAGDAGEPVDAGPTTLRVSDVSLRDGTEVSVSVVVTRPAGSGATLEVTLEGLPALVKATPVKVTLGASETVATFKLSREVGAAAGDVKVTARAATASTVSTGTFNVNIVAGGGLDPSFGTNGSVSLPGVSLKAFGPDGSLYLMSNLPTGFSVEKRKPNGDLDSTYGTAGTATTANSVPQVYLQRAVVGPQGELVVGAEERLGDNRVVVVRFSPTGTFDATFGSVIIPAPANSSSRCRALTVKPTGEVLVAYTLYSSSLTKPTLVQLLANGQPDAMFADPTPANMKDYGTVRVLPGGDILASGTAEGDQASVIRFSKPATLQTQSTWGQAFAAIFGVEPLPDGSVFAAGFVSESGNFENAAFAAARYESKLVIVSPFTAAWSKRIGTKMDSTDSFYATTLDSRQRLVAAGVSEVKTLVIGRFTQNGFDPGFGSGGIVSPVSSITGLVYDPEIVVLPSGALAVAVHAEGSTRLLRLLP